MKEKIKLNDNFDIDLSTLIDTRLLIQANSGGGKSWLIRRILEQSHGKVQQIVIDLEGEFSTLREKYDYILVDKDGDTPVSVKSAALLARRLLELNVSAVINLYELDHLDRKRFVKLFLDSMINAPKELWHPCLVVIDEAHVFCPEKGQAESAGSVIDLATRGRKRGYCAVLATQRLSKLHKDAAAECNNKLVGRTGLDIDMKRAAEELGFSTKEQYLSLRTLESGEFFAYGPAISNEVVRVKIGEVKTTHPKAGSRILTTAPIPPTDKIREILGKLVDLPKEAIKEQETIESLKREIFELKRARTVNVPAIHTQTMNEKEIKIIVEAVKKDYQKANEAFAMYANVVEMTFSRLKEQLQAIKDIELPPLPEGLQKRHGMLEFVPEKYVTEAVKPNGHEVKLPRVVTTGDKPYDHTFGSEDPKARYQVVMEKDLTNGELKVKGGAARMLKVLASRYPMKFTKAQLATLSRLSSRSGTYGTYLSLLKSGNLIQMDGDLIQITEDGLRVAGPQSEHIEDTVSMWSSNLTGGARRMFEYLVENYPKRIAKDEVAAEAGLSVTSGTFGTYLSMLRSNGLVEVQGRELKASENLFL